MTDEERVMAREEFEHRMNHRWQLSAQRRRDGAYHLKAVREAWFYFESGWDSGTLSLATRVRRTVERVCRI